MEEAVLAAVVLVVVVSVKGAVVLAVSLVVTLVVVILAVVKNTINITSITDIINVKNSAANVSQYNNAALQTNAHVLMTSVVKANN